MSLIKKLWPGLIVDVDNGNAANVTDSSNAQNYTETTSFQSWTPTPGFQIGIPISVVSSWEQYNPFVSPATKLNQNEKTASEEKLKEHQGSVKKDDTKYDPTMLTIEMVELVSRVRMFGAKKYARNNFKITGFKYTRSLAAALRHIYAFLNGEDNDPESGLSHLGHAVCSLEHCIYDTINHPSNDDRKSE
jgi:Domain of unknown function (DUF5664)